MRYEVKRPVAGACLNEPDDDIVLQQKPGSRTEQSERLSGLLLRLRFPCR